jgi:polysaccharide export outer membrane protein
MKGQTVNILSCLEEGIMKTLFLKIKTGIWVALLFFLATALTSWAAESSGDVAIKDEVKQQYRDEILGKKAGVKSDKEYVIGYRDILYVEVYGEGSMAIGPGSPSSELEAQSATGSPDAIRGRGAGAEVGPDGRVSLRHIGDAYVVGMTLTQCADYLKKLYSTVYEKPTVITSLVQSNSRQFTMMGQIRNPGQFPLDYPLTVVKAIAKAGGFTEWANSEVTVIRQDNESALEKGQESGGKKTQRFEFDYDDFLKGKNVEKNIEVEPGDVVVVH